MTRSARISEELRQVEQEIDTFHFANPLMKKPFAEGVWYFLAFCEDLFLKEMGALDLRQDSEGVSLQGSAVVADVIVEHMKWPLRWLSSACSPGGRVPGSYNADMYQASWDLSELSREYSYFEYGFTYASAGIVNLELEGKRIYPVPDLRVETRYDAYDRLVKPVILPASIDLNELIARIAQLVRVSGERFSYKVNPQFVQYGLSVLAPEITRKLRLPGEWQLSRYRIDDFHKFASVLYVLAFIHLQARLIAARLGCIGLGYSNSLMVMERQEIIRRFVRYTGMSESVVSAILEDLTYGARKITSPDPALQPFIPVSGSQYCISPCLITASAIERNFVVLMNRIPEEREVYSRLSQMKEDMSRRHIQSSLEGFGLRFWHGSFPGGSHLGDLDLAIISDEEQACLFLELKSFVEPAEVREVIDRSKEIARGIQQVEIRKHAVSKDPELLRRELKIDQTYSLTWAVASETSVGAAFVQKPEVPVVRTPHLLRRLKQGAGLAAVCSWLRNREYLPIEGVHYQVVDVTAGIGEWTISWHGIEPLVEDEYL